LSHLFLFSSHKATFKEQLSLIQIPQLHLITDHTQLLPRLARFQPAVLLIDLDKAAAADDFWLMIKNKLPHTQVLVIGNSRQRNRAVQVLTEGAADYLLLPCEPAELHHKVTRLVTYQQLTQPFISAESNLPDDPVLMLDGILQEVLQTLELDQAIALICKKARQISRANQVSIWLADETGQLPVQPNGNLGRQNHNLFHVAQQVKNTRQMSQAENGLMVGLPLLSGEKLVGVLGLKFDSTPLTVTAHQWMSIFSQQAAIALENARLFHELASAYIDLAQNREKLQHQRHTLGVLFDGISDGLCILDPELKIIAINKVEANSFGRSADELIGQDLGKLPGPPPELINQIKAATRDGKNRTWIGAADTGGTFLKDREFRIYPVQNRLGRPEQIIIFAQNVAEQRRWQASLFRSANLAAVGRLAGSVAHQINNPLTVTMINSQLLMLESASDTNSYQLARAIYNAGERIQQRVAYLQEFSNQEVFHFNETDLISTVEEALALVSRPLRRAKITVNKNYQARPLLNASASHLKLVWINLLLNAYDAVVNYTQQPEISISISMPTPDQVSISISDNGVGLSEQEQTHLFQPFLLQNQLVRPLVWAYMPFTKLLSYIRAG
jgi:nitrogen-specific signal transduction histidine kinase/CheY-like chemotaxis protein